MFEDYTIDQPWVIVLALAHNYERRSRFLPTRRTASASPTSAINVPAARALHALTNWIRSQGYHADAYPGPSADALLLIPPAIASGLGELGKHGSLISRQFGSGVRLAGVTTDMPLVPTSPVHFGADDSALLVSFARMHAPWSDHSE